MGAVRIVCHAWASNGYEQSAKTVAEADRRIRQIEAEPSCCSGPHSIEEWRDGQWVEVSDGE